ncbi:hypothetical protein EV359DRAFT_83427 [Lentinula novae-zelandiae]|nr:hypothetical protein EV359DRAFT_83427 [Lentinula novae-zelandiae]
MSPVFSIVQTFPAENSVTALTFLLSSWINLVLYACEAVLCAYFLLFTTQKITRGIKLFIIVAFSVETIGTVAICYSTDMALKSAISSSWYIVDQVKLASHWSTLLAVVVTYLAALLEQSYFLKRYWSISHNRTVTSVLALLVFSNPALAVSVTVFLTRRPLSDVALKLKENTPLFVFRQLQKLNSHTSNFISVSAAIMATTDISLAIVTITRLKSVRTSQNATQALLQKFCFYVGAYGCVTAVSTTVLLVFWLINLNGYAFVFRILGRIYSLTALVNFLLVHELRAEVAKQPAAFQSPRTHFHVSATSRGLTASPFTEPITQGLTMSFEPHKHSV